MKVTTQAQFRGVANKLLQMGDQTLQIFAIIMITVVGMGSGDLVSDAVGGGRAAHGYGDVP
jgi:hypothetical protein